MQKSLVVLLVICYSTVSFSQEKNTSQKFWNSLQNLCGKAFEGKLDLPKEDKQFGGKKLIMHVRSCNDSIIKIPFFVGEDKSRTWILNYKNNIVSLKHDHRHKDGSEDAITMYGGTSANKGQGHIQVFPADAKTATMIPAAASNVWWITLNETEFTYNLRRLGTPRVFKVVINLTKTIQIPDAPWGWKEE